MRARHAGTVAALMLLLIVAGPNGSWAEDPIVGPPAPPPLAPGPAHSLEAAHHRSNRTFWIAVSGVTATAVYDVESTFHLLSRCGGCREGNSYMRGVFESGRGWSYGAQAVLTSGASYAAYKARTSRRKALRRAWWVPLAVVGWGHVVGGTLNWTWKRPPAAKVAARGAATN